MPIIVRGDGCYLEDANGKRYLDALAGLFAVQIGYSYGDEIGEAAAAQMRELPFYTNWSYAHPRAIELAAEVAALAPGDLNRVFFVSGGSEAVESAWKLARQYYSARGEHHGRRRRRRPARLRRRAGGALGERRWKAISRHVAYHGTTMGALSINGIPALRTPFEPLVPEVLHVRNTNRYHRPDGGDRGASSRAFLLDDLEQTIEAAGPETVAMVIMEPVQNAGGAFTPPEGYWRGVREICDRYEILLCADEVITGFGRARRLVRLGALRHPARPRHLREGALVGVRVDRRRGRDRPRDGAVPRRRERMYTHGITFGGHPVQAAIALKNIEIMKREKIVERVREQRGRVPRRRSRSCSTCRSSATCAARASSTRSSSSRTRRRARRSPTRSASGCCAASSRRGCSRPA